MKKITDEQKIAIEDAANAGLLSSLPPAIVEKDIHITDALAALANVRLEHVAFPFLQGKRGTITLKSSLVFSGGTCLSKAHGVLERMSEDIDLKVQMEDVPEGYALAKSRGDRFRLGEIHELVKAALTSVGFLIAKIEGAQNPHVRDGRRYFSLSLDYEAVFTNQIGALRPQLKVELVHRETKLPAAQLGVSYLLDRLCGRPARTEIKIACITVAETLAEKVLSLLRRCAWKWDGHQRGEMDPVLVRHIYDCWCILNKDSEYRVEATEIFPTLVWGDQEEFGNQHPEFRSHPKDTLLRTLARSRTDRGLEENYEQRLIPLVYGNQVPEYTVAFGIFEELARSMINILPTSMEMSI